MESAKQNLQLIGAAIATTNRKHQDSATADTSAHNASLQPPKPVSPITGHSLDSQKRGAAPILSRAQLINKLNYINFQDGTIRIIFKHTRYDKTIAVQARPQPCMGDQLECQWISEDDITPQIQSYEFANFLITSSQNLIRVRPQVIHMDKKGIRLLLPETCSEVRSRKMKRHVCRGIKVQFIQNSAVFSGSLMDFNGFSFRVKITPAPPQTFDWINSDYPVNIILSDATSTLYSGECRVIRHTHGQSARNFILEPLKGEIQRFKQKEFRSERYLLTPSPNIIFHHPLTGNHMDLKVADLSGSGFSVEEDEIYTGLLPGMILPQLTLSFADSYSIQCSAQVVFRKTVTETNGQKWIKCGLALLDMDIQDHLRLMAVLHQTKDRNSYICNNVDLDALWDFFFETGFIYPDKYVAIQKNKEQIKATYAKIYTQNPHIARHFIYQDKGEIFGHMAMIRFYERAWMIHHHAARKSALNKAGLVVLDQIGRMINDSHRLHSLHMDYMMCYYRPDNKFPRRVFGGAAKSINDPSGCSVDSFAYLHFNRRSDGSLQLPDGWQITAVTADDLLELKGFYAQVSGGLMLDALDLTPEKAGCDTLSREYRKLGLTREHQLYAVKKNGQLAAIFLVIISDVGLNLSDITNCIKIFTTNCEQVNPAILQAAIFEVARLSGKDDFPVLLYPTAVADDCGIAYEKIYNLWICSLEYSDAYFRYLKRLLRFI